MKKIIIAFLAAVAVVSAGSSASAASNKSEGKVVAYYLHGTFRCYSCTMLEKYSKEAIEAGFKDALASGKLEFKAVNVEDRGNEHFVNDYQIYTKSLVLALFKDGKQIKWKNLDKIWEYVRNQQKFSEYVVAEVAGFLKEVQ